MFFFRKERDSGWAIYKTRYLQLYINKLQPLRGDKGGSYIPLPKDIAHRKAVLNIQNHDQFCAAWSIVAALHPASDRENKVRVSSYPHFNTILNLDNVDFPLKLGDMQKIELLNNISINVYGLEYNSVSKKNEVCGPIYYSKDKKERHINLLYISDFKNNKHVHHYCLITNLSRLVRSQITNKHSKLFVCDGCISIFRKESQLNEHILNDCIKIITKLPTTNPKIRRNGKNVAENVLYFEEYEKQFKVPFVFYCDFETVLRPLDTRQPPSDSSYTYKTVKHEPISFAYNLICAFDSKINKYETYTGVDCVSVFINKLIDDARECYNKYLRVVVPMSPLTESEQLEFNSATSCIICGELFDVKLDLENVRVRDHCHLTGKYRGASHQKCNLNVKVPTFIPVLFHNLSCYDSHLFIKELAAYDTERIDVIPLNKEKYISFTKYLKIYDGGSSINNNPADDRNKFIKLRFLDSFRFLPSSLEKLANGLNVDQFEHIRAAFPDTSKFDLIRRKGIFPYSYITSYEILKETKLPEKDSFYNTLIDEPISDSDYEHALKVWCEFKCKTLMDYMNLYLKTDVLLMTDVFENYRKTCLNIYGLDPCHFFTCPGLSWTAMLKYTKIKLELLTDIDKYHFIKKGVRGGICQASFRYGKANNRYMSDYDKDQPESYLTYIDMNNLYGWALSQRLPCGKFKWLKKRKIEKLNISEIDKEGDYGYIFEVDVQYDVQLHDIHNDLPFLPESKPPPNKKICKLIPNLENKEKYVVHYRNLQHALSNGLKISKIHRVLRFKQSAWLKPYIDLNTNLRINAKSPFEKDLYKLKNNAIFGKTMENVEKRVNVKLINHWANQGRRLGVRDLVASINFKNISTFSENLAAIQMLQTNIVYNKPIYIGFAVLDLSKNLMYEFFYDFLLKHFGRERVKLAYMDTDAFITRIFIDDWYAFIKEHGERFDTSNFKPDNPFDIPLNNKAIPGLMKDELEGKIIKEYIALRAKMYALIYGEAIVDTNDNDDGSSERSGVIKKVKGVKKYVVAKNVHFENFKECLFNKIDLIKEQRLFRSFRHDIYTIHQNKLVLSSDDDKRFIEADKISTLAWGHYKIPPHETPLSETNGENHNNDIAD